LAHQLAVEGAHITSDVIEIQEFPDLAQHYAVTGVPKIIVNDQIELMGAQPESALLSAVLQAGDNGGGGTSA
jgi:predicted DsbA family dithiol-disulfide isomerase